MRIRRKRAGKKTEIIIHDKKGTVKRKEPVIELVWNGENWTDLMKERECVNN